MCSRIAIAILVLFVLGCAIAAAKGRQDCSPVMKWCAKSGRCLSPEFCCTSSDCTAEAAPDHCHTGAPKCLDGVCLYAIKPCRSGLARVSQNGSSLCVVSPLRLSVKPRAYSYRIGEAGPFDVLNNGTVAFDATITNTSETKAFRVLLGLGLFTASVVRLNGKVLIPNPTLHTYVASPAKKATLLPPGGSVSQSLLRLEGYPSGTETDVALAYSARPGRYTVTFQYQACPEKDVGSTDTSTPELFSGVLTAPEVSFNVDK